MPTGGAFPTKEAELNNYFGIAVPYLISNAARLGISSAHSTALSAALDLWYKKYPLATNANTRTKTITDEKDKAKAELTNLMRGVFDDIPNSALTSEDRNTLNLSERSAPARSPIPATSPVLKVDTGNRLEHTIAFTDEATPTSRAKPHGVRGCQIWVSIGGTSAPGDPKDYRYVATDTASPYVLHFEGADAGKNAWYIARWENTRGETGPWSDTVMATITG